MPKQRPTKPTLQGIQSTLTEVVDLLRGHEKRFDGIDQRFDGIDQRINGIDQRFDGVDQRLDGMDQRFDKLEEVVDVLAMNTVELKSDMTSVKNRLDRLEHNQQKTFDRLDDFLGLYNKVDLEVVALRAKVERA